MFVSVLDRPLPTSERSTVYKVSRSAAHRCARETADASRSQIGQWQRSRPQRPCKVTRQQQQHQPRMTQTAGPQSSSLFFIDFSTAPTHRACCCGARFRTIAAQSLLLALCRLPAWHFTKQNRYSKYYNRDNELCLSLDEARYFSV